MRNQRLSNGIQHTLGALLLTWLGTTFGLPLSAQEHGMLQTWDEMRRGQYDAVLPPDFTDSEPHRLRLRAGERTPAPGIDSALYESEGEVIYAFAQRRDFPSDEAWESIRSVGIERLGYLGDLTWSLRIELQGRPRDEALGQAYEAFSSKAMWRARAGDKIEPQLAEADPGHGSFDPQTGLTRVSVLFYRGVSNDLIEEVIQTFHQGADDPVRESETLVLIEIEPTQVSALAAIEEISFLEPAARQRYPTLDLARPLVRAESVQGIDTTPVPPDYELSGAGIRLSNSEGIGDGTHEDFWNHDNNGNPTTGRWATGANLSGGDHGVMTGSIMLGNGWRSQAHGGSPYQWRGIAPEATFDDYSAEPDTSNHSFAIDPFGHYTTGNATVDSRIRGDAGTNFHPHVGAVANQGLGIQYGHQKGYYSVYRNAKNEIIVGNLRSFDGFWNGSSLGPTFDGRIKPDISAPGSFGDFPRQATLGLDIDSVKLISPNGNHTWSFNSGGSQWHGGWGDPNDSWWTRQAIGPITQESIGSTTAMSFDLLAPPWNSWFQKPMIGVLEEPDAITPLDLQGHGNDVVEVRYRYQANTFFDQSQLELHWFKDFPDYSSGAHSGTVATADGQWHTATFPVGTDPEWSGESSIRYLSLRFFAPPMRRAAGPGGYSGSGGSSAAAPVVAGSLALLLEKLVGDFGMMLGDPSPSPFWRPAPGAGVVLPSTLKALLVHTATDLEWTPGVSPDPPNPDTGSPTLYHRGPDLVTGYGLLNVQDAVDLLQAEHDQGAGTRIFEDQLGAGDFGHAYQITVPFGVEEPLKVTLAWDDYEGSPAAAEVVPKLVNNLDLVLRDPGGNYHYPWSIDQPYIPSSPSEYPSVEDDTVGGEPITAADIKPARRDVPNSRDNVEKAEVDCPIQGQWDVFILPSGLGAPPQRYSLILGSP